MASRLGVFKESLASAVAILASRVLGLVREVLTASFFGADKYTDAFFLAWKIPNVFRRVLGEGAFNPVMQPLLAEDSDGSFRRSLLFYTVLVSLAVALGLWALAPLLINFLSPSGDREFIQTATTFLRYLAFYVFFASLNAYFMGLLQFEGGSLRRFFSYLSQAVFNLTVVGFVLFYHSLLGIWSLVYGTLLGGFLQVLTIWGFAKYTNTKVGFSFSFSPKVGEFFKNLVPNLGSLGIGQISTVAEAFFATHAGVGVLSNLYYAYRLFQLPASLVGVAVANTVLSKMARNSSSSKGESWDYLLRGVEIGLLLSVPAFLGLFILAFPIVEVIYKHGVFKNKDAQKVALFIQLYSLGLVPYVLYRVLLNKLFTKKSYRRAFFYSLVWFFVEVFLSAVGIFVFHLGGWVIALSSSLAVWLTLFLFLLREKVLSLVWNAFWRLKYIVPLWVFMVFYLLVLEYFLGNPYLVVFVAITTVGVPYLVFLKRVVL